MGITIGVEDIGVSVRVVRRTWIVELDAGAVVDIWEAAAAIDCVAKFFSDLQGKLHDVNYLMSGELRVHLSRFLNSGRYLLRRSE